LIGTIINTVAILAGCFAGILLKGGIPQKYNETVMHAMALAVILIGIRGALKSDDILLVIISLAAGSVAGEFLKIEDKIEALGNYLQKIFAKTGDGISKGFVTSSLLFCVGSMAIVGSLESGLSGNHQTLFAKSILDGIASIILTSTLGIGVFFSAVSVFLYQGAITMTASYAKQFLVPEVINQMTSTGGLLIAAIGINMLEIKRLKVGNMLPAIFIPLLYYIFRSVILKW
jgi:hypothetical protein